jgi:hypothetical protein
MDPSHEYPVSPLPPDAALGGGIVPAGTEGDVMSTRRSTKRRAYLLTDAERDAAGEALGFVLAGDVEATTNTRPETLARAQSQLHKPVNFDALVGHLEDMIRVAEDNTCTCGGSDSEVPINGATNHQVGCSGVLYTQKARAFLTRAGRAI